MQANAGGIAPSASSLAVQSCGWSRAVYHWTSAPVIPSMAIVLTSARVVG
jgi:hypothetical protein